MSQENYLSSHNSFEDHPNEYENSKIFNLGNLNEGKKIGEELSKRVEKNQVNTIAELDEVDEFDEDEFFSMDDGSSTLVTKYDLEKQISPEQKTHFQELERYWVNKPYAFVSIFRSQRENEVKYYAIEPYMNELEQQMLEYIKEMLRQEIKYDQEITVTDEVDERDSVVEQQTKDLLKEYELYGTDSTFDQLFNLAPDKIMEWLDIQQGKTESEKGYLVRPESVLLEEEIEVLSDYQLEKLLYYLKRDSLGFKQIDPIKNDINVEDISCNGYNSPVFVYHGGYEQIITNITHGEAELDDFVVKLAQRSGKGISKRNPQVDVTLPDGSRGQLTLGDEVSDHGTNYTIRQFNDVPFTPIDLINWRTFSLEQMAFLWLCIENHRSLIFAGGTASGKTTSLNAISLFIPSSAKIVSIEDTREVELPQRNWIASVTRPSFTGDESGDVDEFALLEAALRQRPEYIVMGEIRGEEGRTLFQVMSTGHTTYTTFHADSVGEVLKRFTTDPINVSKTMFTALDLVSIQSSTRVDGNKVRRNISLTEINHYDAENDEINVQDVYQWQAETDTFIRPGNSQILEEIKFDRGWSEDELQAKLEERKTILAYLIMNGLNTYAQVAATFQAFINDPETILTLVAEDRLANTLTDLRDMESVLIDIDPEDEERTPRPEPDDEIESLCKGILEDNKELLEEYEGRDVNLLSAIPSEDDIKEAQEEAEKAINQRQINENGDFASELIFEDLTETEDFIMSRSGDDDDGPEIEVIT